jgi:hypothetical protein
VIPASCGVNPTLKLNFWPAVNVKGTKTPLTLNPEPVTFICEMLIFELPEFVKTSERRLVAPTETFPKLRLSRHFSHVIVNRGGNDYRGCRRASNGHRTENSAFITIVGEQFRRGMFRLEEYLSLGSENHHVDFWKSVGSTT